MHHSHGRATLGGKLSAVLVAAGSSVGLGNIWRFPYVAGDNGGGAFLVIYILCVLLLGLPIMVAEFSVGRASHRNAVGAYRALDPKWSFLGYNGVVAAFLILGFYFVVSGWTAAWSTTGACMALAAVASLSLGVLKGWNIFGLTIFDSLDYLTANILLPAGGFFTCIFVGWRLDRKILKAEISNNGTLKFRIYGVFIFLVRYVCPAVLLLIFLDNLGLF